MDSRIIKKEPNKSGNKLGKGILRGGAMPGILSPVHSNALFLLGAVMSFSSAQAGVEIQKTVRRDTLQGVKATLETIVTDAYLLGRGYSAER